MEATHCAENRLTNEVVRKSEPTLKSLLSTKMASLCLILGMSLSSPCLQAEEVLSFPVTIDGNPAATIVIANKPSRAAAFAALELQLHVEKITGARLPIVNDSVAIAGPRILIGASATTRALNVGGDFKPQEYMLRFLPDTLVLMGRDADSVADLHFDESGKLLQDESAGLHEKAELPRFFKDRGSLDAVYDFLERYCDVRWYAPGDIGLVCPTQPTLVAQGADIRRSPAMEYRWMVYTPLYMPAPPQEVPVRAADIWKLRMRLGGTPMQVNHSFEGYYDRFYNDHPEWFAQGHPGRPRQMCYTHPEFIEQVVQDARDFFDGKGAKPGATAMGDVFGLAPMDNAQYCTCASCQEHFNDAERDNPQFTSGYISDYFHGFVDKVARAVLLTHPDKWIGTLGYWQYAYHPSNVDLAPNVKIMLCLHARNWWCPSVKANDLKVLEDWRRNEPDRPIYLWLYYNFPALLAVPGGPFNYFPGFFAHSAVRQMKIWHDARVRGLFLEHSSEFGKTWLMDQLELYVTFKLADNPDLDGNEMINEFFTRYYGAAAAAMQALYVGIEKAYSRPESYPEEIQNSPALNHQTKELAWGALGTAERMAEFALLMDKARTAAKTDIEKKRVAYFEEGIWLPMLEGRKNFTHAAGTID